MLHTSRYFCNQNRIDETPKVSVTKQIVYHREQQTYFYVLKTFYLIIKIEEVVAIKLIVAVYVHLMTLIFHGTFHIQWY